MRTRLLKITAGAVLLAALAGGGVAWATSGDDERSETGPAADRARAAALAHVGGGRATEVERDSEGGSVWEVEIERADGSTLEVRLDGTDKVIGSEADDEDGNDDGEAED
jgi:uncharacterized membrane protein YkoI